MRPKRLLQAEKLEYRRCVILAPWLTEGDGELLVQWCQARSRYQVASKAFDKMLRLPGFAIPGSAVAKAAGPIGRLAHRETMALLNLANRLGFSPQGRFGAGCVHPQAAGEGRERPMAHLATGSHTETLTRALMTQPDHLPLRSASRRPVSIRQCAEGVRTAAFQASWAANLYPPIEVEDASAAKRISKRRATRKQGGTGLG